MPTLKPKFDLCAWFLVGPTASGKTAVAQMLAEQFHFEILAADAMAVYSGMDIGTAKPTTAERALVRYSGLDLVSPDCRFSAGQYRAAALTALHTAKIENRSVAVVGGTGLYIKSLTDGLNPLPPTQADARQAAENLFAEHGLSALQEALQQKAPALFEAITDKQNPRRLIRAMALAAAGADCLPKTWSQSSKSPRIMGLLWDTAELYIRIENRVRQMFAEGLLEETQQLCQNHAFELAPTARQAIGYVEALAVIQGKLRSEEAIRQVILRTRRLAKRQMTWFRHQTNVEWLRVNRQMTLMGIAGKVWEYWQTNGPTHIMGD